MIISSALPLLVALFAHAGSPLGHAQAGVADLALGAIAQCTDGTTSSCTLTGCLKAQRYCIGGTWDSCTCVISTCDDGNACTTDTFNGTACVRTPRAGATCDDGNACTASETCSSAGVCGSGTANLQGNCSDGNACNGAEVCSSAGSCVPGNPPNLDDANPCTYDYCDASGVHHEVMATCPPAPPEAEEAYTMPMVGPSPLANAIPTMPNAGGPVVDLSTGVTTYDYTFGLPAARGRYQPALALRYSSDSAVNKGFGAGWDLTDSWVEVDVSTPPTGPTDSYSKRWRITLGGAVTELRQVAVSGGVTTFKPTIQGALVEAKYAVSGTSEVWTATDLAGNAYLFDYRVNYGGASGRGRWCLSKVTDVDGNETVFTHLMNRLTAIRYNAYLASGTKHYATNIELEYSSVTRVDGLPYTFPIGPPWHQRIGDYVLEGSEFLQAVRIRGSGELGAPFVVGHWLEYRLSAKGAAPVLRAVNLFAGEGQYAKGLPPTEFVYGAESESYSMDLGRAFSLALEPASSPGQWKDLDGDGLPDRVFVDPTAGLVWQRNRSVKGSGAPVFDAMAAVPGSAGLTVVFGGNPVKADMLDMNGDGLADLVRVNEGGCPLEIRLGQIVGGQFRISAPVVCPDGLAVITAAAAQLNTPLGIEYREWASPRRLVLSLVDMNGDGIRDFALVEPGTNPGTGTLRVFLGYGVPGTTPAGFSSAFAYATSYPYLTIDGPDINGDGLPGDIIGGDRLCAGQGLDSSRCDNYGLPWQYEFGTNWLGLWGGAPWWDVPPRPSPWIASVPPSTFVCPPPNLGSTWEGVSDFDDRRSILTGADVDGDGRMDLVGLLKEPTCAGSASGGPIDSVCHDPTLPSRFVVYWNTGSGHYAEDLVTPMVPSGGASVGLANAFPSVRHKMDREWVTCSYVDDHGVKSTQPGTSNLRRWTAGFVDLDGDGVADYVTNQVEAGLASGQWMVFPGRVRPLLLSNVKTPTGASYMVEYSPSYAFGAGPLDGPSSVATRVTVSGPGVPTAATSYRYEAPVHAASALDPHLQVSRGFSTSWSWLEMPVGGSSVAQRTTWATGSSVLAGTPVRVEWGTFTGAVPSTASFSVFRQVEFSYEVRPGGGGACTSQNAEPPVGAYPGLIPVLTSQRTTDILDGVQFGSSRVRGCPADVDAYGNVLRTEIDPDSFDGSTHDVLEEKAWFSSTAVCKNCPYQTTVTRQSDGSKLAESLFVYDSAVGTWNVPGSGGVRTGHLNYVRRWVAGTRYDVDVAVAYNSNGTVAFRQLDPYPMSHAVSTKESYVYDAQGLRVRQTVTTDGTNTLYSDVDYDPVYGWPVREYAPYRAPADKPTTAKVEHGFDRFGRRIVSGRTVTRDATTWALTVTGAIDATEFVDAAPPIRKAYTFQAPLSVTLPGWSALDRPDVRQVVAYQDGLGRVVEVKERLGSPGALDPGAQIVQNLTDYRVLSHVQFDAAGRVVGVLEPYKTPGSGQDTFDVKAAASAQRGAWTSFDELGRVTCVKAGVFLASRSGSCVSSPTDNANHTLATRYTFRAIAKGASLDGAVVPRPLAATKVFGPSSTGNIGSEARYTSDGLLASSSDHDGNFTRLTYDNLGRATETIRQARGVPASAQRTTRKLDALGRILEEWDDDWSPGSTPSRVFQYDAMGRPYDVKLPPQLVGSSKASALIRRKYRNLGRLTTVEALEPSWQGGAATWTSRTIATYTYDAPHTGNGAAYPNTAGRLASIASPLTTIAFGYDQNGQANRRDQWVNGLAGAFSLNGTITDDGRVTSSRFTSPSGYGKEVAYYGRFDSAGRPVIVDAGGASATSTPVTSIWEAWNSSGTSRDAYDALNRIALVNTNNWSVRTFRNYSPYTGNLTAQGAALTTTAGTWAHNVGSIVYVGTRLRGFTDTTVPGTSSVYLNQYDAGGRLRSASASKTGSAPLAQSYSQSYSFSDASWPTGASMGNLEQVTSAGAQTTYSYVEDRVVQQMGAEAYDYLYDLSGRLVARKSGTAEIEGFGYDTQDQLRQIRRNSTLSEVIEYDPLGQPLFRKLGAGATWYIGTAATVTATVPAGCAGSSDCVPTAGSVRVSVHVLASGTRVASVRAQPGTGADPISDVLFYHRDMQGSVVATTLRVAGVNGSMGVRYRYQPYGQPEAVDWSALGPGVTWAMADSELGYTGGLRLGYAPGVAQQGSLLLLGARAYHAGVKRWLQADTVDGLRYTYTSGDPANHVDPSGRASIAPGGTDATPSRWVGGSRRALGSPAGAISFKGGADLPPECFRNDDGQIVCVMEPQDVPAPPRDPYPAGGPMRPGGGGFRGGGHKGPQAGALQIPVKRTFVIATVSLTGGYFIFSGEFGDIFALDPQTGIVHAYFYVAGGAGIGFGGAATLQLGLVNMSDPRDLTGLGMQVSAFATAINGVTADYVRSLDKEGTMSGGSLGYAAGLGIGASAMVTHTWYAGSVDLSRLPAAVQRAYAPYMPR